jgi:hypothetical protein
MYTVAKKIFLSTLKKEWSNLIQRILLWDFGIFFTPLEREFLTKMLMPPELRLAFRYHRGSYH